MMQFDTKIALAYILANFTLNGTTIRMIDSLLQYVTENELPDPKDLLMTILGNAIGFDEVDMEAMLAVSKI